MLYRIKWAKKETLDRLPVFVYIEDGSIYDNMFSEYIRNGATNAVDANVVQLINYQNNACSDFSNLPTCYKSFLEDCNDACIESFSDPSTLPPDSTAISKITLPGFIFFIVVLSIIF